MKGCDVQFHQKNKNFVNRGIFETTVEDGIEVEKSYFIEFVNNCNSYREGFELIRSK